MDLAYSHKLPPCKKYAQGDDENNKTWLHENIFGYFFQRQVIAILVIFEKIIRNIVSNLNPR